MPAPPPNKGAEALPQGHGKPAPAWVAGQTAAILRDLGGEAAGGEASVDDGPVAAHAIGGATAPAASLSEATPALSTAASTVSRLSALAAVDEARAATDPASAEETEANQPAAERDTTKPEAEAGLVEAAASSAHAEPSAEAADEQHEQQEKLRAGPPEQQTLGMVPHWQPAEVPVAAGPAVPAGPSLQLRAEPSGDANSPLDAVFPREPMAA